MTRPRIAAHLGACLVLALGGCAHHPPPASGALPPAAASAAPDAQDQGAAPGGGHSRAATAAEMRVVEDLMAQAEGVRGLRFHEPVPVLVQDRSAITDYIESQIEQDELDSARLRYTALGLLPEGLEIRALLLRLMGEQVVGYYDPERAHFVIRDDVMRAFEGTAAGAGGPNPDEAKMVLVHELVHALQGQHLALAAAVERDRDTDADNAFRSLIEGDATLAMIGAAVPADALQALTSNPVQVRQLVEMVQANPTADPELHDAPPIVRETLLSAYVDGLGFAAFLHGTGGWRGVDAAHRAPPLSTEQILHPERYALGQAPETLAFAELAAMLEAGYELVDEDTLGELEMGVYFELGAPRTQARRAADGWGGDRLRTYRHPELGTAVLWLTTWDSEADALEAADGFAAVHRTLSPARQARSSVQRSKRAMLVLQDLDPSLQKALLRSLEPLLGQLGLPAAGNRPR